MAFDKNTFRQNEIKRQLADINQSISDIVTGGQSFSVSGGISVSMANLTELKKLQNDLNKELIKLQQAAAGTGCTEVSLLHMRTRPHFDEPRY